jgi:hypothetical protein
VFVVALDGDGNTRWVQTFGGPGDDRGRAIFATPSGLFIAGLFQQELQLGADTLVATGGDGLFFASLDPSSGASTGSSAVAPGTLAPLGERVALAGHAGGVMVGGEFGGTIDFGCEPLTAAGLDGYVVKLDAEGCAWQKRLGDRSLQTVEDVGVDASGDVVIAGEFNGAVDFEGAQLVSGGGIDIFVAKLDSEGRHLWSHRFGNDSGLQGSTRLAVHALGNVAIAGYFEGAVDFGSGPLTSTDGHDLYLAKLDPSGNLIWVRHFPTSREPCDPSSCILDEIDIAADAEGNLVIVGHFEGSVDFGGTRLDAHGGTDMFLAKLDVDGELMWSGHFGDERSQCQPPLCRAVVAVDSHAGVLVGGYYEQRIDFGLGALPAAQARDGFVARFGP